DLLSRIYTRKVRRLPKRSVKIKSRDAGRWRINDSSDHPAANIQTSTRDANPMSQHCQMPGVQQRPKQFQRLRRDKLAAHFMTRQTSTLQQQDPSAFANSSNSSRAPSR